MSAAASTYVPGPYLRSGSDSSRYAHQLIRVQHLPGRHRLSQSGHAEPAHRDLSPTSGVCSPERSPAPTAGEHCASLSSGFGTGDRTSGNVRCARFAESFCELSSSPASRHRIGRCRVSGSSWLRPATARAGTRITARGSRVEARSRRPRMVGDQRGAEGPVGQNPNDEQRELSWSPPQPPAHRARRRCPRPARSRSPRPEVVSS